MCPPDLTIGQMQAATAGWCSASCCHCLGRHMTPCACRLQVGRGCSTGWQQQALRVTRLLGQRQWGAEPPPHSKQPTSTRCSNLGGMCSLCLPWSAPPPPSLPLYRLTCWAVGGHVCVCMSSAPTNNIFSLCLWAIGPNEHQEWWRRVLEIARCNSLKMNMNKFHFQTIEIAHLERLA